MELLIFLFKSGLSMDEMMKTSEGRAEQFREVPGLIQKYYVLDKESGQAGGVYVFESKEHLSAFKDSDLAMSTGEAYKFVEPPHTRVLEIAKVLRED
ncbi:MAG: YdhR family protein [Candidatus Thorarchaeota archaeon]|jgi:hypothetical protein